MASIGEVTATLKADIGQYVGPMQQAAQATAQVQTSVENASKALLAEGAAGQAAGKGLASFGASTQQLAQQLAQAEGRLTQLQSAFTTLGIAPAGREFARATAEVERLRAALAQVAPIAAKVQQAQVAPVIARIGTVSAQVSPKLTQLRGTLTSLASTAVGIPGPLGNLASKLLLFGTGGGVTIAVAAGLAVIATAFTKLREKAVAESKATEDAVDGLVQRYREATGAILRENKERAQGALEAARALEATAQRGTAVFNRGTGGVDRLIDPTQVARAAEEVRRLEIALRQANDELAEFHKPKTDSVAESAERAQQAFRSSLQATLNINTGLDGILTDQLVNLQKQLVVMRQQKDERAAMAVEDEKFLEEMKALTEGFKNPTEEMLKQQEGMKGDSSLKDAAKSQQEDAVNAMRGVADAMSRGFADAFTDNQKNLADRIGSALIAAAKEAMVQLLASKVFGGVIEAIFGGGKGGGGLGGIIEDIPVIGNLFSAPSLPAPESVSMGMGATIVVPLDGLPRALSPVEYARDDMWRSIWVETARQAQMNGVNLQPRF